LFIVVRALNARGRTPKFLQWRRIFQREALLGMLSSNVDIMIRTLVLIASFSFFADQSARFGEVVLASNHILLQLVSFAAFFLDGYAFVVEALVGRAKGANHALLFRLAVVQSTRLALVTALLLATLLLLAGDFLIALLTDIDPVRAAAAPYLGLAAPLYRGVLCCISARRRLHRHGCDAAYAQCGPTGNRDFLCSLVAVDSHAWRRGAVVGDDLLCDRARGDAVSLLRKAKRVAALIRRLMNPVVYIRAGQHMGLDLEPIKPHAK
jgi:hypothetical protein